MAKSTKSKYAHDKVLEKPIVSTDALKQIWIFDNVDHDGRFHFSPSRKDMDCVSVLDKIIHYSTRTWQEIKRETHDNGKSKHHHLTYDGLSEFAKERVKKLRLEDMTDDIFSIRLDNMVRIIGIRDGQHFIVKWFDSQHEFYPVDK